MATFFELIGPIIREENKLLDRSPIDGLTEEIAWGIAFTSELSSGLLARYLEHLQVNSPKPEIKLYAGIHLLNYQEMQRGFLLEERGAGWN